MSRHDVVVLGTGASGLMAAVAAADAGADVGLYEKSDLVGGTTAMSGGIVWVPNNHHMAEAGLDDSRQDALTYLESLSLGAIDSDIAAALVDTGPEMIRYVEQHTPLEFHVIDGYPDYHPEHPGGKSGGGRSLDPGLFSFAGLGPWAGRIRNQRGPTPMMLTETALGGAIEHPPRDVLAARIERQEFGLGLALVGGLLRACLDRGVEPVCEAEAAELLTEDGRVTGVGFTDGQTAEARRGVIIATGGFEWDDELCRTFLRGPMTAPAGTPTNTGDGLRMAIDAGARLGNMANAWWVPVIRLPDESRWGHPAVHLVLLERTRPRSLMVNRSGRRFCNEAANYNALGGVFHQFDPATFGHPNLPAWLVFDEGYRERYERVPGVVHSGATATELADAIGVPGEALADTIARFNEHAANGVDPDFGRGTSAYDTFNGDRSLPGVQATLGPLDAPPYHAVEIEIGSLGTNGGAKTDTQARVLSRHGGVVPGLYAAGNAMAAATGRLYGGAGGTLGPAMTFGYIAGRAAAGA